MFACFVPVFCGFVLFTFYDRRSLHWQTACVSSRVGAEKVLCIQYVYTCEKTQIHISTHTKHAKYRGKTCNSTPGGEVNTICICPLILMADKCVPIKEIHQHEEIRGDVKSPPSTQNLFTKLDISGDQLPSFTV